MYPRGIEIVSGNYGQGETPTHPVMIKIPKASDEATRVNTVVLGSILCQCTAGTNSTGDAWATSETTGTASRKGLGQVVGLYDIKGNPLTNQVRTTAQEGYALIVPLRGNKFRCLEDAVGGGISNTLAVSGFVSLVIGTPLFTETDDTNYPNPEAVITLDSSTTASGTLSNRAVKLAGVDGAVQNALATTRAFVFTFTDAFTEAL